MLPLIPLASASPAPQDALIDLKMLLTRVRSCTERYQFCAARQQALKILKTQVFYILYSAEPENSHRLSLTSSYSPRFLNSRESEKTSRSLSAEFNC